MIPRLALLLPIALFSLSAAAEPPVKPGAQTFGELTAWKKPHGTWQSAASVTLSQANPKSLEMQPGKGAMVNRVDGATVDLLSEIQHGDCQLHVEFLIPGGSNSGVYLQGRYEVQIFDSFGRKDLACTDCGGLYEGVENGKGFPGKPPALNASKAPGEWQTYDITFRAPRFDAQGRKTADALFVKVVHNGQVIHENVAVTSPTRAAAFQDEQPMGPLKLQGDHGPVAFRNVRLTPATL